MVSDREFISRQQVGGASVEHLSLLAHLASLALSHPPIIMVTSGEAELPKLRPFLPLRSSLPCDIHLLNLRTLEDEHVVESTFTKIVENFWCLLDIKSNFLCVLGNRKQKLRHRKRLCSSTGGASTAAPHLMCLCSARGAHTRR